METIRLVKEPEKFRAALYDGAEEIGQCTYVNAGPGSGPGPHHCGSPVRGPGTGRETGPGGGGDGPGGRGEDHPPVLLCPGPVRPKPEYADVYEKE